MNTGKEIISYNDRIIEVAVGGEFCTIKNSNEHSLWSPYLSIIYLAHVLYKDTSTFTEALFIITKLLKYISIGSGWI